MTTKDQIKVKTVKPGTAIRFTEMTEKYGRAEFQVCPVVKRGKLREIFLYPRQQTQSKLAFRVEVDWDAEQWGAHEWSHKTGEHSWVWLMGWCKQHKCQMFCVYPPKGCDLVILAEPSFWTTVHFEKFGDIADRGKVIDIRKKEKKK